MKQSETLDLMNRWNVSIDSRTVIRVLFNTKTSNRFKKNNDSTLTVRNVERWGTHLCTKILSMDFHLFDPVYCTSKVSVFFGVLNFQTHIRKGSLLWKLTFK